MAWALRIDPAPVAVAWPRVPGVYVADTPERCAYAMRLLDEHDVIGIDTETYGCDPRKQHPKGLSKAISLQMAGADGAKIFVPLWGGRRESLLNALRPFLEDETPKKVAHNWKWDAHALANHGIQMRGLLGDTLVMDYLEFNGEKYHGLKECMKRYFNEDGVQEYSEVFREPRMLKRPRIDHETGESIFYGKATWLPPLNKVVKTPEGIEKLIRYSVKDPQFTARLYHFLKEKMQKRVWIKKYDRTYLDYYECIERPFTQILFEMEREGCPLDMEHLQNIKGRLESDIEDLEREFLAECVMRDVEQDFLTKFNMNSTKQVCELLYTRLGIKCETQTPGGLPSTATAALEKIVHNAYKSKRAARNADLVSKILKHRKLVKLHGTYIEPFLKLAPQYNNRVHTNLKQCMPAGELVLTSRGYIPVECVKVGDSVLTHKARARKVTAASPNGVQPVIRIRTNNGLTLRTTGNHRYKTPEGWVRADKLMPGDTVLASSNVECWRRISAFDVIDGYSVSSWGRVRNDRTGCILSQLPKDKYGHLTVGLFTERGSRRISVHRLVSIAFLGKQRGPEVRHLNGVAWDNTVENLRRGTRRENIEDALRRHGTYWKKLTVAQAQEIADEPFVRHSPRKGVEGTNRKFARRFNISEAAVSAIRKDWSNESILLVEERDHPWLEVKVVATSREEPTETFGLTVEEDHSHVTGGLVTHNTGTSTGRISSAAPNLLNIPAGKKDDEYQLRKAFTAPDGYNVGDIDLSQIELRLTAHSTKDPTLIALLQNGWDQHLIAAKMIFPQVKDFCGDREPTKELSEECEKKFGKATWTEWRRRGKILNFGIIYGMREHGFMRQVGAGISEEEAKETITNYFDGFPTLLDGIRRTQRQCYERGYVRTYARRYIMIPDVQSYDHKIRARAERQAFNAEIQGGCADLIKMGMILCWKDERLRKLGLKMVLQIYDELVFLVKKGTEEVVKPIVEEYIAHPYRYFESLAGVPMNDLVVDTPADFGFGPSWHDAKS